MKPITVQYFLITAVFILALSAAHPVQAHGGEPRLEISAERLNPGGVVDVRGVDFEPEELITLALIGPEFELPLGQIIADTEGIFLQVISLPVDLPEGAYNFRAITDDHEIISPMLIVFGSAILEGGDEGQREEDDGLLAPMPTFAPGVVPEGVSQAAAQPAPREASISNRNSTVFVVLGLLMMGILVALGLRAIRKS